MIKAQSPERAQFVLLEMKMYPPGHGGRAWTRGTALPVGVLECRPTVS